MPNAGIIEGGHRHVFDFASDKANGTIRSLSLTSKLGGNKGWRDYGTGSGSENLYLCRLSGDTLRSLSGGNNDFYGYPILSDFGDITRVYSYYNGVLSRYDLPNAQRVLLNDGRSGAAVVQKTILATVESRAYMYWYDNKFHQVWTSSTTQIRHKSWDLSGTLADDITITISGVTAINSSTNSSYAFFLDGNYYVKTATGWAKVSDTGAFITYVDTTGTNGGYPVEVCALSYDPQSGSAFLDTSISGAWTSNSQYLYILRNDKLFRYYRYDKLTASSACTCLQCPWLPCAASNGGTSSNYNRAFDIYPYSMGIATINNLATPVVKTAAQSMKITYEIRHEQNAPQKQHNKNPVS